MSDKVWYYAVGGEQTHPRRQAQVLFDLELPRLLQGRGRDRLDLRLHPSER